MGRDTSTLETRFQQMDDSLKSFQKDLLQASRPGYGGAADMLKRQKISTRGQTGEFKNLGELLRFARDFATNPSSVQDRATRYKNWVTQTKAFPTGMNETIGADGGVLVAPEFANMLLMRMYENDIMSRTTLLPMGSNVLVVPAVDETSRQDGGRFGGVLAYWKNEAETLTASKPGFQSIRLQAERLNVLIRVTEELQEDANVMALETVVGDIAAQELQFKVGDAILNGDGVNKPLGFLTAGNQSKVTVPIESAQTITNPILTANILKMWARVHPSCRGNAVWFYDQSIEPFLYTITIGTGSAAWPVFVPAGGLSASPYTTILGRPAIPTEFNRQVGTEGDIVVTDMATYLMGTRGSMDTAVSMHVYYLSHELAYRFSLRVDGKPWWSTSLVPKSGGDPQSCTITLGLRV